MRLLEKQKFLLHLADSCSTVKNRDVEKTSRRHWYTSTGGEFFNKTLGPLKGRVEKVTSQRGFSAKTRTFGKPQKGPLKKPPAGTRDVAQVHPAGHRPTSTFFQ
ncbi:MAG: hypothetical protein WDZ59_03950 [Pirellulales bacterium]